MERTVVNTHNAGDSDGRRCRLLSTHNITHTIIITSASEVTTLRRYTNLFIIIIIILLVADHRYSNMTVLDGYKYHPTHRPADPLH